MKCPICGTTLPLNSDRCPDCGYHCNHARPQARTTDSTTFRSGVPYDPPNKSSRSKCCCCAALLVIPLLLLLIAAIVFSVQMVMEQVVPEDFIYEFYEDAPAILEPLPDDVVEEAFSIHNGEVTFLPHNWDGGSVLQVPETVDGQTVTALAPGCFRNCADLTTIVLPDTVTRISQEAFSGCRALRGLLVPMGAESIDADAFSGCVSLEAIYVPESVTYIAPGCFDDCASLIYIFYDGSYENWNALYSSFINPFTTALCVDGAYYHGVAD